MKKLMIILIVGLFLLNVNLKVSAWDDPYTGCWVSPKIYDAYLLNNEIYPNEKATLILEVGIDNVEDRVEPSVPNYLATKYCVYPKIEIYSPITKYFFPYEEKSEKYRELSEEQKAKCEKEGLSETQRANCYMELFGEQESYYQTEIKKLEEVNTGKVIPIEKEMYLEVTEEIEGRSSNIYEGFLTDFSDNLLFKYEKDDTVIKTGRRFNYIINFTLGDTTPFGDYYIKIEFTCDRDVERCYNMGSSAPGDETTVIEQINLNVKPAECYSDADCDDNNLTTIGRCNKEVNTKPECVYTLCDIECKSNEDCDDDNILTSDTCYYAGTCKSYCINKSGKSKIMIIIYLAILVFVGGLIVLLKKRK